MAHLEVVMPVQTEHRFPLDLSVLDAAAAESPWPTCAARRGRWPCTSCAPAPARSASTTPAPWPGWTYPPTACSRWWWYPDRRRTPPRSDASSATGLPSCPPLAPRRTWRPDCTGPCSFNTVASCSSTRPASCDTGWRPPCPPAASTAQRCRPRSTGCNTPTILPNAPRKDDNHAAHRCRGRKRGLLRPCPGYHRRARSVADHRLAPGCATVPPRTASGTRCRTGGGRDRHTGVRVRPVRGRRARYPGTRRTARAPRRRRPVPVRAQPHLPRARRHDPRPGDSAVAARPVVVHGFRRARAGRLGLWVGAAGAAGPVRRAVRRIPAGGTGLVATSQTLAAPIDRRRPRPTPDL